MMSRCWFIYRLPAIFGVGRSVYAEDTRVYHQLLVLVVKFTSSFLESNVRPNDIPSTAVGRACSSSEDELNVPSTILVDVKYI